MGKSRCVANCNCSSGRREFIKKSAILTAGTILANNLSIFARENGITVPATRGYGVASGYVPVVKAAFVRRNEEYGMRWPGAVYDGEAARTKYTEELKRQPEH